MTTAQRVGRRLIVPALLLTAAVGCTESGGAAEASCAYVVTYEGRSYLDVANIDFTVGERLGTATIPECDDTPNDPGVTVPEGRITAYAVEGTDPAVAIAVGDTPAEATLMKVR
ncbi:hypothetical protein SAMN04487981_103135 [Streptomyces sp. cf386]|uniref:DUF6281 family protein n=1 Tax=Streptomyces sp. cf386 TaxID=1761904 RepID=UPI00088AB7B5|nr:DUF6281 family protein [Streptomyces sp. cf386]SDM97712.1 hypothetical protein SAMN04487981_103135 [Streptomyces sp. cf386]